MICSDEKIDLSDDTIVARVCHSAISFDVYVVTIAPSHLAVATSLKTVYLKWYTWQKTGDVYRKWYTSQNVSDGEYTRQAQSVYVTSRCNVELNCNETTGLIFYLRVTSILS